MTATTSPAPAAPKGQPAPSTKRPLYDVCCGAGGCTRGYKDAGFSYVVGVDLYPQKNYVGDEFIQMDALEFFGRYLAGEFPEACAFHCSPPCQRYSKTRNLQGNVHPDLIAPIRKLLRATGKPYVIENVQGAPLADDAVMLVGSMFGLRTMRPRLFECSFPVPFMLAPMPEARHAKMGRPPKDGEYVHVVGHMSNVPYCRDAMGISWMTQGELAEAIPPAMTQWIGAHLMTALLELTP